MPIYMVQDRHPRGILVGESVVKSNRSSSSDFEDDIYDDAIS